MVTPGHVVHHRNHSQHPNITINGWVYLKMPHSENIAIAVRSFVNLGDPATNKIRLLGK